MIHPDYYIFKTIKAVIGSITKFCGVTIGGIPVNAIAILALMSITVSYLYSNSVKEQGVLSSKTKELLSKPSGLRWLFVGAGVLIALIWSL